MAKSCPLERVTGSGPGSLFYEIIYPQEEPGRVLKLAEEKAKYMRIKNQQQGKINFEL